MQFLKCLYMLFAEASMDQVRIINKCINAFCNSSGLKVNNQKTRVFFSHNVNHIRKNELCDSLGFSITSDLGKYLGVPLHHNRVTKDSYQFVVDKVKSRLSSWKANSLSSAGRSTLISSVTTAIPGYVMQTSLLPLSTCETLDRCNRSFLWGNTEDYRKVPLVAWEAVCKPKLQGGLGLRHAKDQNRAYLMKIGWCLSTRRDDLWVNIIRNKYNCGTDKIPRIAMNKPGSNLWNGIKRTWGNVQTGIETLATGQLRWKWSKSGEFSVKTAYDSLISDVPYSDPLWGKIWKIKVPERCKIFIWLVVHGRLLTNASRFKRGLSSDARCPVCGAEYENIQHVLKDCPETSELWRHLVPQRLWRKFNSLDLEHWLRWNITFSKRGSQSEEWRQHFVLICWWLWRRRNTFVFEGKKTSNHTLQCSVNAVISSLQDAHSRFTITERGEHGTDTRGPRWMSPLPGWVKVNTDGAFSHIGMGVASGGVIRDANCNFLKGFMFRGMDGDSLSAELWGCLHGLKLAWDLGHRQVILESDSADAVELMKQELNELHEDRGLIAEIHHLMKRDWRVEVGLISRWANGAADHLAKASLSVMPGFHTVMPTDMELDRLLAKDRI